MPRALTASVCLGAASLGVAFAQQKAETFDVFTFTAPVGWTRDTAGPSALRLSRVAGGQYCLFDLYRSARGTGRVDTDFQAGWADRVAGPLKPDGPPEVERGAAQNGWQNQLGGASFAFEGGTSLAVLSTYSQGTQTASILMLTNDPGCLNEFDRFLGSVQLSRPTATTTPTPQAPNVQPVNTAFAFNTTTFSDGWVSVEQKAWVLARKGNVAVRVHYPNPALGYEPDSDKALRLAWNTLIAPRYRDLQNYQQDFDTLNFERPYLASATATSVETGQRVYVALFKQAESGWIEIVTPDEATFVQTYGVTPATLGDVDTPVLQRLRDLRGLNRFAVAASDLKGEWSSSANSITQWVNAFTGLSAGATGFSSNVTFVFGAGGTYTWKIALASGVIGAQTFQSATSNGKFTMTGNWQINFSDIERKPKLYNAYFEVGTGGQRILWLQDSSGGTYSAFVRVK